MINCGTLIYEFTHDVRMLLFPTTLSDPQRSSLASETLSRVCELRAALTAIAV